MMAYYEKTHLDHQIELTKAIREEAYKYQNATGCSTHVVVMALKEVKDAFEGKRNSEYGVMKGHPGLAWRQ